MTTKPIDGQKVFKRALQLANDGEQNGNTVALLFLGVHIVEAIDRLTRATNRQTAALRDSPLEDRDLLREAEAEARRDAGAAEDFG